MIPVILFIAGLVLLISGAEILVRGSSRLASALGVSKLVIGLTVVAFGTSSPELAVSVRSGLSGLADISVGNVVGSNLFNILLILGISAVITPLVVSRQLIRLDVPIMIGSALLIMLFALDGTISRVDGAVLFTGMIGYTIFLVRQSKKELSQIEEKTEQPAATIRFWSVNIFYIVLGLFMLITGSGWLVKGAVYFAETLGLSSLVIGLTIIAAGTSLPEVATSIVASLRGERDIAIGNVVGSNIFNILMVLGLSSLVTSGGIQVSPSALRFDIPVMIAVSVACLPIFFTGYKISRWEGFLFLSYYIAYTAYIILRSSHHKALPEFSAVMTIFVIPLTAVTLIVVTYRAFKNK
ncbi:calcium/sodium antiporter [candidate division KSB1 bacterium]|nr:calcium/sodium antiporter [candidate division KSB1 bacterium]